MDASANDRSIDGYLAREKARRSVWLARIRERQVRGGRRPRCIWEGGFIGYEQVGCCKTLRVFQCLMYRCKRTSDGCGTCGEYKPEKTETRSRRG